MTKSQTFHSIRRDALTTLQRLHLLARSFARTALVASLLLVAPVENLSARDVRAEVEKHNASIQETERERKHKAMCLTPFTFYRATAHLFYQDIAEKRLKIPPEWDARKGLRTWISGDFHLQNVGFEDPGSGQLCFELNDFDESCQAPFYWDLIRLVASVYLVKDSKDWPLESKDDKKEQMKVVVLEAKATSAPAEVKTGALLAPQITGGEAKRVSDATRALTARTDDHEGWFNADGVSYHVTRISPLGDGVKLKDFEKREQLEDYLQWSAVALANAHCRANPRFASEALRAFRDFKEVKATIRDIGRDYVAQVGEDYDAFREK